MLRVARNENFGKLQAGYLFPEVRGHRGTGRHPPGGCCARRDAHTAWRLPPPVLQQIARRRRAHQEAHPDAQIISLGIGDTTEPLPQYIADAMAKAAAGLATREGYSG